MFIHNPHVATHAYCYIVQIYDYILVNFSSYCTFYVPRMFFSLSLLVTAVSNHAAIGWTTTSMSFLVTVGHL
ncbi:hypothetical protein Cni_G03421 [Canna indica]|uniref:Uncharacterized protein n=1 Tax=Canna indica TaxID=4628 RepID=A0AAQ3JR80_9LILI|nr:hypothetical protein Cni_G03421 [Canna indica]